MDLKSNNISYPLSPTQLRQLTIQLLEPAVTAYNMSSAVRIQGEINIDILRQTLQYIVDRHESLRTIFQDYSGVPRQTVLSNPDVDIRVIHLDGYGTNKVMDAVDEIAIEVGSVPFDIAAFPLFRTTLIRFSPEDHVLLLTIHHIISDDHSNTIFFRDFFRIYESLVHGKLEPLPPPEKTYAEFAESVLAKLNDVVNHDQIGYWTTILSGDLVPLQLPTFRPRPARASHEGSLIRFQLNEDLSTSLKDLNNAHGVSMYTVLCTAFFILLYKYTGSHDITVGSAFSMRDQEKYIDVIGNFLNTVALRTVVRDKETYIDLLKRIDSVVDGAAKNIDLPFDKIVESLDIIRDPSYNPIFQVMFVLFDRPVSGNPGHSLRLIPLRPHNGTAKVDLTFLLWEEENKLQGAVEYSTALFDKEAVNRFIDHYYMLLTQIIESDTQPIGDYNVLSDSERHQIVHGWNDTSAEYSRGKLIHQLFEEKAAIKPNSIAVEFGEKELTYLELNQNANRLAHHLISIGVGPDVPVAVCIERSINMVVGILGVLKSGGYYVPIDPDWPSVRMVQVFSSIEVKVVVTQTSLLSELSAPFNEYACITDIVCLDSPKIESRIGKIGTSTSIWANEELNSKSNENPERTASSEDIAYVIFTSGSTGVPKGVVVKHDPVINLIEWVNNTFSVGPKDRLLFVTSLCFDLSVYDVFGILAAGGRIVVASSHDLKEPQKIIQMMYERKITFWDSAPAMLRQLTPFFESKVLNHKNDALRLVFLSGDWIPLSLPDDIRSSFPDARVIGLGGATEATIWSNFFPIDQVHPDWRSIPYGRPIQNARYYVLDGTLSPCPIGVAGDLYIGGRCLASGYANDPEKTADKFITDPFVDEPDGKMYKTGDRARFFPDGNIEFLGRLDHQVKIRGFRIELGEIERALSSNPEVRHVIVKTWPESGTDRELVAYISTEDHKTLKIESLRSFLKGLLPEYMIPLNWVFLDEIPLTSNGKVDLAALPAPGHGAAKVRNAEITAEVPRDDLEVEIAEIWREVLGLNSVGLEERFFDIGGTSLKAAQLIAKINKHININLQVLTIFEKPTISQLVDTIRSKRSKEVETLFESGNAEIQEDFKNLEHTDSEKSCDNTQESSGEDTIAIIGMSVRVPGAEDVDQFWSNLVNGIESINELSEEELESAGIDTNVYKHSDYVPFCSTIPNIDYFDAAFFNINPREAELMDPQHRVFLECAWSALENAGYDPYTYAGMIGVFGGVARNAYFSENIATHPELLSNASHYSLILGNDKDYPATRISYKLDLKGPSINIQSACSSSGVALHLACRSLRDDECDMALIGGCRIIVPAKSGYLYVDGGTQSPDGHVRAFDAQARGMVRGSGVGFVVLKRTSDAIKDSDHIYAIVKSSAINNDGAEKVGFTAPSVNGQSTVITKAIEKAGISADSIGYVEAHGTGTSLGDPIEIAGLTTAFRRTTEKKGYCRIGSVKTNIGHLDAGAGVVSVIKAALSLYNKKIPPSLNFKEPNPQINFADSPFIVNTELYEWESDSYPRHAGVSTFGLGGTNVHIILEESLENRSENSSRPFQLLLLSAKTPTALDDVAHRLADHLERNPDINIADLAFTLQLGRVNFDERRFLVSTDVEDAKAVLLSDKEKTHNTGHVSDGNPQIVFMFPGQGSQHHGMAYDIYTSEPFFREIVDYCCEYLEPLIGCNLCKLIYSNDGDTLLQDENLQQTRYAQPAIFVVEYALARLWMHWGVEPKAMIGHSIGEFAAACIAGVFELDDCLSIVAARAKIIHDVPEGCMRAVKKSEDELKPFLNKGVSLAAVNAPSVCVVSGSMENIASFDRKLEENSIEFVALHTSHAFHSDMMEPAVGPFTAVVTQHCLSPPRIPFISSVTGTWIENSDAADPKYWSRQLREPVRFSNGIKELQKLNDPLFLEVGPSTVLSTNVSRHKDSKWKPMTISSLPHAKTRGDGAKTLLSALGRLWISGIPIDWKAFYSGESRRRLPLPTYPFERKRFWIDKVCGSTETVKATFADSPVKKNIQSDDVENGSSNKEPNLNKERLSKELGDTQNRKSRISSKVSEIIYEVSGINFGDNNYSNTFLEMGLDSLLLTQLASIIKNKFGISIRFRQLMEELNSIHTLVAFLDSELPESAFAPNDVAVTTGQSGQVGQADPLLQFPFDLTNISTSPVPREQVFKKQLQIMSKQLEIMGLGVTSPEQEIITGQLGTIMRRSSKTSDSSAAGKSFGAGAQIDRIRDEALTKEQADWLDTFISVFTEKTRRSKQYAEVHRDHFADPRTVTGFSPQLKELVYPITVNSSKGTRLWDIDGNMYIDLTACFGANLLGHSPSFVTRVLKRQLKRGVEIGPQHPHAGEAARLMAEMTGFERVVFCNTGSEAVMGALRLVRTVTGKNMIVTFSHSYHGNFDEVIVRGTPGLKSIPGAPGIPANKYESILVLEYGEEDSLRIIRDRAEDLAAVMVEPVQSRDLSLQPQQFLLDLRRLTEQLGIALICDELITGFRAHLGGAQAYFGFHADIATYGKIVGGGMPIGVIAGKADYMDALDGGAWRFGDDSIPEKGVTYFAGTFVRHPLAMAAARQTLEYLQKRGPQLQAELNRMMDKFVKELRDFFRDIKAPVFIKYFSSSCRFYFYTESPYNGLFYHMLRSRGIHIYENRTWFLNAALTEKDLCFVIDAIKETVAEMIDVGFIQPLEKIPDGIENSRVNRILQIRASEPPIPKARIGRNPYGDPAWYIPDDQIESSYIQIGNLISFSDKGFEYSDEYSTPVEYDPFQNGECTLLVPATESQKEIWLTARMGIDGNCAFNESVSVHLFGDVQVEQLMAAIKAGIERHEALRTTFNSDGTVLCITSKMDFDVDFIDFSIIDEAEWKSRLDGLLRDEVTMPFDLIFGPLVQAKIVKLRKDSYQIIITSHHVVCDGWSIDVVVKDIGNIYTNTVGEAVELSTPENFSWYALYVTRKFMGEEYSRDMQYWLDTFSTNPPPLELPLDFPRPRRRSFDADRVDLRLDSKLRKGIQTVASQTGCTFVTVLLAAFNVLLHKITGQEDIVVGLPAAGQSMVGKDALVGHCVNLLPLRSSPRGSIVFSDFVKSFRSIMLDAYEHQQVTFGSLLTEMQLRRDPSRIPLVSTIFNIDMGIDLGGMKFDELSVDFYANPRKFENFELFLNVSPAKNGEFVFEYTYNTNLFLEETIHSWANAFFILLEEITKNPGELISNLSLLSPEDQKCILNILNHDACEYPKNQCVYHLFEEQVERTPESTAVIAGSKKVTYSELDAAANRLAQHLLGVGIVHGDLIGIFLNRSADVVVTMFGILKAGCAYVPLDPLFPQERLALMLEDSGCKAIVTNDSLLTQLPKEIPTPILFQDTQTSEIEQKTGTEPVNRLSAATSEDLAYVIYTSGSTGTPKGVEIRHRSLVNFLLSMKKKPGFRDDDVLLAVTTISFDISGLEIYLPLICGGTTVIADSNEVNDGRLLLKSISSNRVSVMQATPTTWEMLLEAGWKGAAGFKVFCGGEAMTRTLSTRLIETGAEVWNLYGPTETTIWSTVCKIDQAMRTPMLGQPIANTKVYILDEGGKPVSFGVPGELYIGGDGLARGYYGKPDLTNEKFVTDPFTTEPYGRMYKTGDLVRLNADGSLEFLGRKDNQVKLRGYRIELGDIESSINAYPGINNAITIIREDVPGVRRLTAYYTLDSTTDFSVPALKDYLQSKLPLYMVPAMFVEVDDFPLTPNGKIDRKSLPEPAVQDTSIDKKYEKPRNETELKIVQIWEHLLNIKPISISADFFDLGGDSLLAARFFAQVEKEWGRSIPLATLFESSTIKDLAPVLSDEETSWASLVPVQPRGTRPPLFLVHGAEGNVLLYRELSYCLGNDQPVYGLQSQGLDGKNEPLSSIEEMATKYVEEIIDFYPDGPYYLGGYCMGGAVALEIAQRLVKLQKRVNLLAMIETYNLQVATANTTILLDEFNKIENVFFHVHNIIAASKDDKFRFLIEKIKVEMRRLKVRKSIFLSNLTRHGGNGNGLRYHHKQIDKHNDKAHSEYRPSFYPGKITLFRPIVHFTGYQDPYFGWGDIAKYGVDVNILKVRPHGMLVQPYVRVLAKELEKALAKASQFEE